MEASALLVAIAVLAFSVALNLWLTLRVLRATRSFVAAQGASLTPPIGQKIPEVAGRRIDNGGRVSLPDGEQPAVLLFLSSTCPKCREKLPEISKVLALREEARLALWLVSREPAWRLRRFLRGTGLASVTLRVALQSYKALNPTLTSPYYLFLDEKGALVAGGLVGDEDWQSFQAQMAEIEGRSAGEAA